MDDTRKPAYAARFRENPDHQRGIWPNWKCQWCGEPLPTPRNNTLRDHCDACVDVYLTDQRFHEARLYYGTFGDGLVSLDGGVHATLASCHHRDAFHFESVGPRIFTAGGAE
jgi:hypothetical protein